MSKDWQAVSAAIKSRLDELDMTQAELSHRAGVALETVRELQHNLRPRRRSPRTLGAVSEALGWPSSHLAAIADGQSPDDPDVGDPVLSELDRINETLTYITARLDAIERQLADDDGRS
ncbi:helix-turn-helix transcriptional regulator [Haloechinothrix sp. YIM 98757]|uniref:Helix-turn-helix transcriptional regulator n=1 Tax=Haloechinothrix aidingensis TaxID=2752311 RepID=A0A838A0P3_9PSEU|nr:helix-turn-helix transcriptional regulator [Haloechinothrix aidingensis]MBA0124673.1 helix-turn-helix transcriptional regulator [Haloechinothrix aidingensis]